VQRRWRAATDACISAGAILWIATQFFLLGKTAVAGYLGAGLDKAEDGFGDSRKWITPRR
jgi:hypothetical protein